MRKILVAILLCAIVILPLMTASGQQNNLIVSGKVTDKDGSPLIGTNVSLVDHDLGNATNVSGMFSFKVPVRYISGKESKVTARFIGYHSQTKIITLRPGKITVDFVLTEDVLEMDAVVVTGVAEDTPKKLLPFTVSRVSKEQVEMVPQSSPVAGLQGKVAGVTVVSGSGKPGSGLSVRLRGSTNIGSGNGPLYIVDGVILSASQVDIDAMDIESMEVVKGAAAAALYGSRAASGVINIRTKRGDKLGEGQTRIVVRNEFGMNQFIGKNYRSEHHEFAMNADGTLFLDKDGNVLDYKKKDGSSDWWRNYSEAILPKSDPKLVFQDKKYPSPTFDHVDQFFNAGQFMRNNVNLSQHKPGFNFNLSFGNIKEPGVIDGVKGYRRQNVRLNIDQDLRDDLSLGTSVFYASSWRDDPQASINPFYSFMFMSPMADLLADNDDGTPYRIQADPKSLEENPLYASHMQDVDENRKRLTASFNLLYKPVRWFNLEGRGSYDKSDRLTTQYYFKGFKSVDNQNNPTGRYSKAHSFDESINADLTASFYKNFGDLSTKTKFRYRYEESTFESTNASGENLAVNGIKTLGNVTESKSMGSWQQVIRSVGYYGNIDLNYKDKYIGSLLARYDGSSLFGIDERYHLYYRGSGAWRITAEPFWNVEQISEFKLRASYGTAGSRPGFRAQYETFNVNNGVISKGNLGNKNLKPAFSQELEVGIEMAFLDRFSLDLTYSKKNTSDQILGVPLAAYYGYGSQTTNAGDLETNTIEAEFKAFLISKKDMNWSLGLIFDRTREKITSLNRPAWRTGPASAFYMREGETHGAMYGYRWLTSAKDLESYYINDKVGSWSGFKTAFAVNDDGYLVPVGVGNTWKSQLWGTMVDVNGDGVGDLDWGMPVKYTEYDKKNGIANSFVQIGNVIPDFSIGLTNSFRYKGFSFYALINASIGGDIYNRTRQWAYRELRHYNVDQYGKAENEKKPLFYYSKLYDVNKTNAEFVEDGTYLKLREVALQYRFDKMALTKFAGGFLGRLFHGLKVGIIGRNLLTFTNYSGFDPEVGSVAYRVDNFGYPHFRSLTGMIEFEL